jgi:hypothetical protein
VAEAEATLRWRRYLEGRDALSILLDADVRLLEAERELSGKKADLLVCLENHLHRVQQVEKITQLKIDAGSTALQDLNQSKFYRVQAEILLERAKGP